MDKASRGFIKHVCTLLYVCVFLQFVQPMQSLRGVHGPNGVTHITVRHGRVVSCGRDGHCRTFSMRPTTGLSELNKFKVCTKHTVTLYVK